MPNWEAPTDEDMTRLAKQWLGVANLVKEEYQVELDRSTDSLLLIQRILDDRLIEASNTYGLQCLGMAFGHIMCANYSELDWWIIDDEYGRDPTLRYEQTSLQLNALTLISKRVEDGEDVDVQSLYASSIQKIEELAASGKFR